MEARGNRRESTMTDLRLDVRNALFSVDIAGLWKRFG
jgi:hypothetical protein